jgi:hypothetical protein
VGDGGFLSQILMGSVVVFDFKTPFARLGGQNPQFLAPGAYFIGHLTLIYFIGQLTLIYFIGQLTLIFGARVGTMGWRL